MNLFENLRKDIEVGRQAEVRKKEEKRRKEIEAKKRRPVKRNPNRLMVGLGIVMEKTKPLHPVFGWVRRSMGELMRYAKRDLRLLAGKVKRRMENG